MGCNVGTKNQSYYQMIDIQMSAGEGAKPVKVDRDLANQIMDAAKVGNTISVADAAAIGKAVADGGKYGSGEKPLVRALYRARDDRFNVQIGGQKIRITDAGEQAFTQSMAKVFGSMGGKTAARNAAAAAAEAGASKTAQDLAAKFAA